jgi:hypothetical protein
MSKMPTAEYLIREENPYKDEDGNNVYMEWQIKELMLTFAKLHVEAALKEASEKADTQTIHCTHIQVVDKNSILNSYPLDKIK